MLKYLPNELTIGLIEVPGEISLCIPITNCHNHCVDCHSPHYKNDTGNLLMYDFMDIVESYHNKVTCVVFMGGDHNNNLVKYLEILQGVGFKTALYSGKSNIDNKLLLQHLDYLKIGPFIKSQGGLSCKQTNQRMYTVVDGHIHRDITHKFWKTKDTW